MLVILIELDLLACAEEVSCAQFITLIWYMPSQITFETLLVRSEPHRFVKSLGNRQEWQALYGDAAVSVSKILNHGIIKDLLLEAESAL